MDFEFAFKTLWGVAVAAFWFWVNGLSGRLKDVEKRYEALKDGLHDTKLAYQTKAEAKADRENIASSLTRIENKLEKLSEKLDKKADKQ